MSLRTTDLRNLLYDVAPTHSPVILAGRSVGFSSALAFEGRVPARRRGARGLAGLVVRLDCSKSKAPPSSPAGALLPPVLRFVIPRQRFVHGSQRCQFFPAGGRMNLRRRLQSPGLSRLGFNPNGPRGLARPAITCLKRAKVPVAPLLRRGRVSHPIRWSNPIGSLPTTLMVRVRDRIPLSSRRRIFVVVWRDLTGWGSSSAIMIALRTSLESTPPPGRGGWQN
jgi:hypothetical protein